MVEHDQQRWNQIQAAALWAKQKERVCVCVCVCEMEWSGVEWSEWTTVNRAESEC